MNNKHIKMFVWPAVPTIANKLAPEGKQGSFQGYVNSASTIGKAIGPLLGGMIVDCRPHKHFSKC